MNPEMPAPANDRERDTFHVAANFWRSSNTAMWQPVHLVVIVLLIASYLYLRLFTRFVTPYFVSGDQTYFWQYALRLSHGEHVFGDFFQFTPPGLDLYFLLLFKIFGPHIWVTNLASILLGLMLGVVCFAISIRFMSANESLITSLLYSVFLYGGHLDATHHWFSVMASLSAVAVLFKERTNSRIIAAGVLLAVASLFTQTSGVVVGIAISLSFAWECVYGISLKTVTRRQCLLAVSFFTAWLAMTLYFGLAGGWRNLWYCQFIYPWQYVDAGRGFLLPSFRGIRGFLLIQRLGLYLLLLIEYPLVLLVCYVKRQRRESNDMAHVLLATAGLSLLLAVIGRSNWARLYPISLPGVILAMSFVTHLKLGMKRVALSVICIAILCMASLQIRHIRRQEHRIMQLPGGEAAIPILEVEELCWLRNNTKPGDSFFEATWPSVYLPLGLSSPVFVETLLPDRTPHHFVKLTVDQLVSGQTKYILLSRWLWRHPDRVGSDRQRGFLDFLDANYERVHVFSNEDEVWQRRQPVRRLVHRE